MTGSKRIATHTICGGVEAELVDVTSHYFGGYYHVRIQVSAYIPLSNVYFETVSDYDDALKRLGVSVHYSRTLEKMAVPEDMIEAVRMGLIESFQANELPYLLRENFIKSFVRSEYRKALKPVANFSR